MLTSESDPLNYVGLHSNGTHLLSPFPFAKHHYDGLLYTVLNLTRFWYSDVKMKPTILDKHVTDTELSSTVNILTRARFHDCDLYADH